MRDGAWSTNGYDLSFLRRVLSGVGERHSEETSGSPGESCGP